MFSLLVTFRCPHSCIKASVWLLWQQCCVFKIFTPLSARQRLFDLSLPITCRCIVGVCLMMGVALPRLSTRRVSMAKDSLYVESTSSCWTPWRTPLTGTEWLGRGWWWSLFYSLPLRPAPTAAWTGTSNSRLVLSSIACLFVCVHACMCAWYVASCSFTRSSVSQSKFKTLLTKMAAHAVIPWAPCLSVGVCPV